MPGEGMEALIADVLLILGSSAATALIAAFVNRRKAQAEMREMNAKANQIEKATEQSDADYYQRRAEGTRQQMHLLEAEVKGLKASVELATTQYEQRAGTLHAKIDGLVTALDRANSNLDTANDTIAQLRQEVKDGNVIIADLRLEVKGLNETIAALLAGRAKERQEAI